MKLRHLNFLLIFSMLLSCNDSVETSESKKEDVLIKENVLVFDKLLGTWKAVDGKSFERWSKNPDGSYASASYSLSGADTSWNEMAKIFSENGKHTLLFSLSLSYHSCPFAIRENV